MSSLIDMDNKDNIQNILNVRDCEDESNSETGKAFEVLIWCDEGGTDYMCITGTVDIHTGPDQPNSDRHRLYVYDRPLQPHRFIESHNKCPSA